MEIPTKVVRYFLGMTVLFDAPSFLHKFRFVAPQNDTERVRVKTITDHVRHDLAARPAGKFQFAAPQNDTERVRQETKTDHVRHDLSAATRRQIPIYLLAGGKPNAYSKIKPAGEPWL